MKVQELRIGNLIFYHSNFTEETRVKVVDLITFSLLLGSHEEFKESYLPIPLTEEWLIKLGFEHYNQLGYNIKNNNFEIDIWFDDNGTINDIQLSSTNISGAYPNIKNFQYLHQIQNLYFTLTGEELKLK